MKNKSKLSSLPEAIPQKYNDKSFKPVAVAKGSMLALLRPILALLGLFFIIIGVPIAFLTPIPFVPIGLPIVILGVVLLARNSLWGRRWMQNTIAKHPSLERFAPNWLLKLILGDEV